MWSAFSSVANSTFRPYQWSAAALGDAMAFMQPMHVGVQDSQYRQSEYKAYNNLAFLQESSFISDTKFVTHLDFASSIDIFGTANKFFQVGFYNYLSGLLVACL